MRSKVELLLNIMLHFTVTVIAGVNRRIVICILSVWTRIPPYTEQVRGQRLRKTSSGFSGIRSNWAQAGWTLIPVFRHHVKYTVCTAVNRNQSSKHVFEAWVLFSFERHLKFELNKKKNKVLNKIVSLCPHLSVSSLAGIRMWIWYISHYGIKDGLQAD